MTQTITNKTHRNMKIPLDRKLKLLLLHWLKDGSIDTEEMKNILGGQLTAGDYDLTDFTDDELITLNRMLDRARKAYREKNKGVL